MSYPSNILENLQKLLLLAQYLRVTKLSTRLQADIDAMNKASQAAESAKTSQPRRKNPIKRCPNCDDPRYDLVHSRS